jgi:hypothetical protein
LDIKKFKYTHIPTQYSATKDIDERFMQVKVYVLHLGDNYNGSVFTKEVVENAIPSLSLTPLLGFVKFNENEKDFKGHEVDLVIEQGEYKWKYKGQAYGVIPEQNNARWEVMTGSDNIEREYLVVDAIIWKKFDDVVDIFSRDLVKGQSMELSDKYSGHFNENGLFVFDQFKFDGCAILGDGIEPAMNSAKVEIQYSLNSLKSEISTMLKEFYSLHPKEVETVGIEALLKEYGFTREQVIEKGIDIHTYSDNDLEKFKEELEKIKEEENKEQKEMNDDEKDKEQSNEVKDQKEDKGANSDFDKKDDKSEVELDESKKMEENKKDDGKDAEKIDEANEQSKNKEELNAVDKKDEDDLKEKFEKLTKEYEKVISENEELVKYKKQREKSDHQSKVEALISSFEKLSDSDVKEIREKVFHFTVDEIEEKLYAILGKKQASDKVKKSTQFAKLYVSNDDKEKSIKPSYEHLFDKHLKK